MARQVSQVSQSTQSLTVDLCSAREHGAEQAEQQRKARGGLHGGVA